MSLLKALTVTKEGSRERSEAIDLHRREKEKIFDQNYTDRQNMKNKNKLSKIGDKALSLAEQLSFTYATEHLDSTEIQIRREVEFECSRTTRANSR
jgi:hypothetical protein